MDFINLAGMQYKPHRVWTVGDAVLISSSSIYGAYGIRS